LQQAANYVSTMPMAALRELRIAEDNLGQPRQRRRLWPT
jgi:hypothetical protein